MGLDIDGVLKATAAGFGSVVAADAIHRAEADGTLEPVGVVTGCQHCETGFVQPKSHECRYTFCPHCGERLVPHEGRETERGARVNRGGD